MNSLGLVAAAATFFSVWLGHVAVRKIEFASPTIWLPTLFTVLLGLGMLAFSLFTSSLFLSTVLGILGITLLWDSIEFTRQQRRVRKGHAPANPHNPRHARMLAEPGSHATMLDLLKRDPIGRPVTAEEAIQLLNH
jgi:hypothetical protein